MKREALNLENHKLIIFDCDGTLADTLPIHWSAWEKALAKFSSHVPLSFVQQFNGHPTHLIVREINQAFALNLCEREFLEFKEQFVDGRLPDVLEIPYVCSFVRDYHGRIPLAVLSGGKRAHVEVTLKAIGLDQHFDLVVCGDDPGYPPKSEPDCYFQVIKHFNLQPAEVAFFDDANLGLDAARRAGLTTIDVRELQA